MEAIREYSVAGARAGGHSESISPRIALTKASLDTRTTASRARNGQS